jgi:hypothetical protein
LGSQEIAVRRICWAAFARGGQGNEGREMQSQEDRIGRNDSTFREANEKIAVSASEHEFVERVPFICECATESCLTVVRLSLAEYEQVRSVPTWFFVAPGHQGSEGIVSMIEDRERYLLVEKGGRAGEVATEVDPRSAS